MHIYIALYNNVLKTIVIIYIYRVYNYCHNDINIYIYDYMVVIVTVIVISLLCLLCECWSPASPAKKTPTLKLGKVTWNDLPTFEYMNI